MRCMKIKLVCQSSFIFITEFIRMYLFCPVQTEQILNTKKEENFMENIPESCEPLKKHIDWSQHNPMTRSCK